ncbi:hypothetical protein KDK_15400 [Dictyobacter kobayashii]|uniref:Uncharacterized protein n=1 Tax=Dictyobacter kobayashii TaxID=2014872 RepID=A0A402AF49_9CHLR|nr:hypothetical protein KDK_15400 [Dictyobacter kobayashii]
MNTKGDYLLVRWSGLVVQEWMAAWGVVVVGRVDPPSHLKGYRATGSFRFVPVSAWAEEPPAVALL